MKPTIDIDNNFDNTGSFELKGACVYFKRLRINAKLPVYASEEAAGADVFACIETPEKIEPLGRILIPTGFSFEIPKGYEIQIRARSGLALNNGVFLLNSPGTIDSDYRGEIGIILANFSKEIFTVFPDMRIAQMIFSPIIQMSFKEMETLQQTKRGDAGFGSTGL